MAKMLEKIRQRALSSSPVVKAAFWFTVCSIIQKSVSMLTLPIFSRLMTTEQYGLYSSYNAWLSMMTVVVTLNLSYAVFNKGMNKFKDEQDLYTSSMQSITTVIAAVFLVVFLLFPDEVSGLMGLSPLVILLLPIELLVSPAISFWSARRRYDFRYKPMVAVSLIIVVANAGFGLLAVVLSEDKGLARIVSCVLVQVFVGLFCYIQNLRCGGIGRWSYAKYALLFNLPLLPHYLSIYMLDQFDRVMIQHMVGLSEVAIYSVACNIGLVMKTVTSSINSSFAPWQYRKLDEGGFDALRSRTNGVLVLCACCAEAFVIVSPELVFVFGGDAYADASYIVPPIALGTLFSFAFSLFVNVEFYYDRNKFIMLVSMFFATVNVVLNLVCIPLFGYVSAAYITLLCYALMMAAHLWYSSRVCKAVMDVAPFDVRFILVLSAIAVTLGILIQAVYPFVYVRYGVAVMLVVVAIMKRHEIVKYIRGGSQGDM